MNTVLNFEVGNLPATMRHIDLGLSNEDQLWASAIRSHVLLEARKGVETSYGFLECGLWGLSRIGVYDETDPGRTHFSGKSMVMQHLSSMAVLLWVMIDGERQRVGSCGSHPVDRADLVLGRSLGTVIERSREDLR